MLSGIQNDKRELSGTKQCVCEEQQDGRRNLIVEESLVSSIIEGKGLACLFGFFLFFVFWTSCICLTQTDCKPHTARTVGRQANENPFLGGGGYELDTQTPARSLTQIRQQERQRRSPPSTGNSGPTSKRQRHKRGESIQV